MTAKKQGAVLPDWADEWTSGHCGCGARLCRPECYCGGHADTCSVSGVAAAECVVAARQLLDAYLAPPAVSPSLEPATTEKGASDG